MYLSEGKKGRGIKCFPEPVKLEKVNVSHFL